MTLLLTLGTLFILGYALYRLGLYVRQLVTARRQKSPERPLRARFRPLHWQRRENTQPPRWRR